MNRTQDRPSGRIRRVYRRARRPDRGHMDALKLRVPYWFLVVSLLAFASFQIWMNPFGFSDLTQRYAQDVSDLLIMGPHFYGTEGRDNISVALIDEDTLHALEAPWPWRYGDHARALDALLQLKPKAVVVDFLFVDPRPDDTLTDLVQEIERYRKAGVRLYFEGGVDLPYGEAALRPELARATRLPVLDPAFPINAGVARQYNATGACFGAKPDADGTCPSLALRVFRDVYPQYPLEKLNGLMELVWGTRTAPENRWITYSDEGGARHSCGETMGALRRWYLAFFDTASVKTKCPYNAEIPVEALMMGAEDKDIPRLVKDRVVFYGGALEGAQDRVYTPVNGLISSVFVHAMALDNLITSHGRPEQNVVTLGGTTLDSNPAQIAAVLPVILILSWFHWRGIRRRRQGLRAERDLSAAVQYVLEKAVEKLWHYLAFALALGVGLILMLWAGLSVANWVEVVFVSAELAALLLVGAPDAFWGYLHHIAGGEPQYEGGSA
ncbi:MAG TPA: CHASE2 domain-containing protein [Rhizomicrobium sp.]|jgi:CHASE2 domain-containing sensor protein|nr:CHASE2 domain-containing protein [Rhizomicrobium sp.]